MDKKNKHKRPNHSPASIDGFVSGRRILGQPHQAYRTNNSRPTPSLGSMIRSADGFYPLTNNSGGVALGNASAVEEAEQLLDEPILLDHDNTGGKRKHRYLGEKYSRRRNIIKRGSLALLALFVAGAAFFAIRFYIFEKHLFRGGGRAPALAAGVDPNKLKGEGDGRVNVLLLGAGGPGHDGGDLTDTIMLVSIDPVNHKASMLSLPRDLWVKIPGDGSQKLNAAYAYGKEQSNAKTEAGRDQDGVNLLDQTLENVLGIPIHYHAVINFKAFQQVVDAVGGVDANVPKELTAHETFWVEGTSRHYRLDVPAGQQHFDGTKALYFSRERHNDSDFVRSQRQRLILTALKSKIFNLGTFSNPVKMSNLLGSLGSNVYTDFSLRDLQRVYEIGGKIPAKTIGSTDLVTAPHDYLTTGNIGGLSVVVPKAGNYDYSDIQNYVRNTLRDGFIAKENAKIAVYNATNTTGLASRQAGILKSYGYYITTVDNAPSATNPATTKIIDLSHGADKYTRHYLENRFHVTASNNMPAGSGINPPAGTNFVIILGVDVANSGQN